ncbi:MAG TPA: hypothetical protein VGK99_21915 [Acidobacteriota bacterium]|jgi:hypothetical protein
MNLIATQIGRTILMVPIDAIAPLGGVYLPSLFSSIQERYRFGTIPNVAASQEQAQKEGFKFTIGKIRKDARDFPIQDFTAFQDGMVCTADNTEVSEFFIEDLLKFLRDEFDFRQVTVEPRKFFFSQITVQFKSSANRFVSKFDALSRAAEKVYQDTYGIKTANGAQLHSLTLDFDKTELPGMFSSLARFLIERRINTPYADNLFISTAPLRTADHIKTLNEIEQTIAE